MKTLSIVAAATAALLLTACGEGELIDAANTGDQVGDESSALAARGRFELFTGKDGKVYFHLLAANGEKVLQSQGYSSSSAAQSGIDSVKSNGATMDRYFVRETVDGAWYLVLIAHNGEIIGLSQMYATQSNANRAATVISAIVKSTPTSSLPAGTNPGFQVFKGIDAQYYFHLRAGNGEIVLQSQGYSTSSAANSGVVSVQTNGVTAARFAVLDAADGNSYFVLRAANGHVIGRSETYQTEAAATAGVQTVIGLLQPAAR